MEIKLNDHSPYMEFKLDYGVILTDEMKEFKTCLSNYIEAGLGGIENA